MRPSGYISRIRANIGNDLLIVPATRILIENDKGEFLFIRRTDNGKLGLPAGGMEENETVEECIIREVKEETGLDVLEVEVIGISTNPTFERNEYSNGDMAQYFCVEFYSNKFSGELKADGIETSSVAFMHKDYAKSLPHNEKRTFESLGYFRKHLKLMLK